MTRLLEGMVAVVSGAASGIGRATAAAMADAGAVVVAVDRDERGLTQIKDELGAKHAVHVCDVADRASCDAAAAWVGERFGRVDVLVNCAGIIRRSVSADVSARDVWDAMLRVNLDGAYNMVTAFLPVFPERGGAIVNFASTHAFVAGPGTTAYSVTKSGVHALTFNLAAELGPRGIRVNAIAPGYTETPMNIGPAGAPNFAERFGPRTPLGRAAQPEDIALPAVFLASDMARYVTGVTLRVDGGYLCY
jgi:NAD(P)-dependent dehydrogenase (short-subunit alcohol dehydrogenase family)